MSVADTRSRLRSHFLRLGEKKDISSSDIYWEYFWEAPKSASDYFEGISNSDIRNVCNTKNFVKLLRVISLRLIFFANDDNSDSNLNPNVQHYILNCLRILTRLLPYFYENPIFSRAENQIFWSTSNSTTTDPRAKRSSPTSIAPTVGTAIDSASTYSNQDYDRASIDGNLEFETHTEAHSDKVEISLADTNAPLGAQLVNTAVNLAFTRGFTLPSSKARSYSGIEFSIWEPGIGLVGQPSAVRPDLDSNRLEVLRFLITLCSQCMYNTPSAVITKGSKYLTVLVSAVPKLHILTLLSSLINLTCRSSHTGPENGLQSTNNNLNQARALTVTAAFQLLTLMVVYPLPKDDLSFLNKTGIYIGKPFNSVRFYFGKLHKEQELNLIIDSMIANLKKSLRETAANDQGISLSSMMKLKGANAQPSVWAIESVMLLWELYQCNKFFKQHLITEHGNELTTILVFNIHLFRKLDQYASFVRVCSYFLLLLTSDHLLLSVILRPVESKDFDELPETFRVAPAPTTYRDFLVAKICQILITDDITILSPTLNEILFNLIPVAGHYDTSSSVQTQNRRNSTATSASSDQRHGFKSPGSGLSYSVSDSICQLIIKYSGHKFLTDDPGNPDYLAFLIRAICQAICRFPKQSRSLIFNLTKNINYLENIGVTIENMSSGGGANGELPEAGGGAGSSTDGSSAAPNQKNGTNTGVGTPSASSRTTSTVSADNASINDNKSVHSTENGNGNANGVDPKHSVYAYNHRSSIDEDLSDEKDDEDQSEVNDSALRPKPPTGMSMKAKGKLPRDAPLKRTWAGHVAFNIILQTITFVKENISESDNFPKIGSTAILNKIEHLELESFISSIATAEFLNSKTKLEQLRFVWTNLSLGWYESILWGCIFAYNETISRRFSKVISLNSTISTFSKVSSDWGFGRWSNSDNDMAELVQRSLITTNIWYGTRLKLFKTDKFVSLQKGNLSEQLMRKFSDFKLNGSGPAPTASPSVPPRPSRQNSTTSVNSVTTPSSPKIAQDDYFGDPVMSIKVTPRTPTHRLSINSNLNSPRNLTRNNSAATTPLNGSPRNSIAL